MKKKTKRKLKPRKRVIQHLNRFPDTEDFGDDTILKLQNPSEPIPPMIGLSKQLERDMFQQPVEDIPSGQIMNTLLETAAAEKTKEDEEEDCTCGAVLLVIAIAAIVIGIIYSGSYLLTPHYKAGQCYSNSYDVLTTARVTVVDSKSVYYQYADYAATLVDTNVRDRDSFKDHYNTEIDCADFFSDREFINKINDNKQLYKRIDELREENQKLKDQNAHRVHKG